MSHYPEKSGARLMRAAVSASVCGLGMATLFVWAGLRALGVL